MPGLTTGAPFHGRALRRASSRREGPRMSAARAGRGSRRRTLNGSPRFACRLMRRCWRSRSLRTARAKLSLGKRSGPAEDRSRSAAAALARSSGFPAGAARASSGHARKLRLRARGSGTGPCRGAAGRGRSDVSSTCSLSRWPPLPRAFRRRRDRARTLALAAPSAHARAVRWRCDRSSKATEVVERVGLTEYTPNAPGLLGQPDGNAARPLYPSHHASPSAS